MHLINETISKIEILGHSGGAYLLAQSLASACNSSYKISLIDISSALDFGNVCLVQRLALITHEEDFDNGAQDYALRWLREKNLID